ncbi:hypothetical protein PFISCL1PPCAC_6068 [Pristionchus fissidentatus]|uniref:Nonsense-mediated mRNA decay factor SMG8 n=1 Tax=Pristionchus fissidentatus TaxID=1538716 RepID=A0AAV5V5Y2_9BILA|nr:hypothetical protein PFISCL1PPCAC_6068 [Pristionchus fissidentatus]
MGGTKPLPTWIHDMENLGASLCKEKGLVIITVLGKDSISRSKIADINEALGGSYLNSWGKRTAESGSIEVFFSIDLGALFLVVNTYKDVTAFSSMEASSNEAFFEYIGSEDKVMESDLAVAFSLSHLVLIMENACRVELPLLDLLQNVNMKRMELRDSLPEETISNREGRFGVPRFIFAFHRHLIRKDLGHVKRKELLEKLEQSLEDQTFSIFKHYRLLSSGGEISPGDALGHIWGEGYIHLMEKTSEVSSDDILSKLFSAIDGSADEKEDTDNRLFSFLNSHIKKVREGKKLIYSIPSHQEFLIAAKGMLSVIDSLSMECREAAFISKLKCMHMEKAREKYMPSGANRVLSRVEHEQRMNAALESLESVQVNPMDWDELRESFENLWSSDLRSCEIRSLLGNECRLAAHASVGDAIDREKWTLHSSSVTHVSACNCGRSQMMRSDPFTLKEANCDFYAQFNCCERAMETHHFKVVADETGRRLEEMEEEWPEARLVGQGERSMEEKGEEEEREEWIDEGEEGDEEIEEKDEKEETAITQSSDNDSMAEDDRNYLDNEAIVVKTAKDEPLRKGIHELEVFNRLRSEGIPFVEGVPHTDAPDVRPLFPSWSLLAIGTSSVYGHSTGIRGQFGFIGKTHLLPLDVYLEVDAATWYRDMSYVESLIQSAHPPPRNRRIKRGIISERVKLFIGMEYECSAGHRQLGVWPFDDGIHLVENDLPLYQPCAYRKTPCENAQLMRMHIVTPKAPVTVSLNPKIVPSSSSSIYCPGESLDLTWSRYYILRLPWVYSGPEGVVPRPSSPSSTGLLLANSISVSYSPLATW